MLRSPTVLLVLCIWSWCGLSRAGDPVTPEPQTYEEVVELTNKTPGAKNLRKIGLALHGYHDIFRRFPPAVLFAPNGQTYSWRVELLPVLKHYVDRVEPEKFDGKLNRERYNQLIADCGYDITEPWDSPQNAEVLKQIPEAFRHPVDDANSVYSSFYAVVGEGMAFDTKQITSFTSYKGELSWLGSTLLVVESRSREPWTKPVDIVYSASGTVPHFGGFTKNGFLAVTCEGAVHFIPDSTPPDMLRALLTKSQDDAFTIVGVPFRWD